MAEKEYEMSIYLLEKYDSEIKEGKEIVVEIRDHATYECERVKAVVAKSLPQGNRLWIRNIHELLEPEPMAIKIAERLDEDEIDISVVAKEKRDIFM